MKTHWNCKFHRETELSIIEEYLADNSASSLARKFDCSHVTILNMLTRYGIRHRSQAEEQTKLSNARKHFFNERFFDTIDSETKAYLLGLMFADGWMNSQSYGVYISSTDLEIPSMFKKALELDTAIRVRVPPKGKLLHEIGAHSKILYQKLFSYGCVPNKSLILKFPTCVPSQLLHHFIRGYWDGDGSICLDSRKNLCAHVIGTQDVITNIQEAIVSSVPIGPVKIAKARNIFQFQYHGNWQAFLLRLYLYKDATLFLQRKKDIWFSTLPVYRQRHGEPWGAKALAFARKHPEFPTVLWERFSAEIREGLP